jgi:hypothetical protein
MHFAPLVVIVRVVLLRSSWRSFVRAAPSIMRASNSSPVFTFSLYTSHRSSTRQFQTAVSQHPLTIGHMYVWTFLLRIIDNTTSQNIYYSSWNTLYISFVKSFLARWIFECQILMLKYKSLSATCRWQNQTLIRWTALWSRPTVPPVKYIN